MKRFSLLCVSFLMAVAPAAFAGNFVVLFNGNGVPADFAQRVAALGGTVTSQHAVGIASVSGLTDAAAASLATSTRATVQPDAIVGLTPARVSSAKNAYAPKAPAADTASAPATAYLFPAQWDMRAIGADIAWSAKRLGSPTVTVAILDSGIDYKHADLAGRVDLSRSTSFVPSDDALVATYFPNRNTVTDLHFHGTHVAATVSSNAIVGAGMTSKVTLIGVKVLDYTGHGPFSGILNGVLWAADHGADVINMSLGGDFFKAGNGRFLGYMNRVFNYANRKGAVVVVAAGNDQIDLDHDGNLFAAQCDVPNVVCVAATGPTRTDSIVGPFFNVDAPAFYSNFGRSAITVAAPGGNIGGDDDTYGGWVWEACSSSSLDIPECQASPYYYVGLIGTSQATPHVSGLAALIVEQIGHGKPAQVKSILQRTADDLGQPGVDPFYGKGRINVPRALGLQ